MFPHIETPFKKGQKISLPLSRLKGVGPKRASLLAQKGLFTILDLFYFTPLRYQDRTKISRIKDLEEGKPYLTGGRVVHGREEKSRFKRKGIYRIILQDDEDRLELLWFHYRKPYLDSFATLGGELIVYGSVTINRGIRQMIHPDITPADRFKKGDLLGFYPVYPSLNGIQGSIFKSFVREALDSYLDELVDPVPRKIIDRFGLPALGEAIRNVHFPPKDSSMELLNQYETPAHKRLIFDRFFSVMLALAYRKTLRDEISKSAIGIPENLERDIRNFFPFSLTADQKGVIKDIERDFAQGKPMNRLLMGDVGSGKTVVAAIAAYIINKDNKQTAIMAPTQVLAEQHEKYFSTLPSEMGFRSVLLTGNMKGPDRRDRCRKIRDGYFNLIIGTHSLIQEDIIFSDMGLTIIDEQHRFGVRQRSMLDGKGNHPHVLVMTATPIPRSLALTLWGDADISIMQERPGGYSPVKTILAGLSEKRWIYETICQRMSSGEQVFVICPVIDESEEEDLKSVQSMGKGLRKILSPRFKIGVIHGRLTNGEKENIMHDFHIGHLNLLVATTVIEVGVHVPNATVMIIEHPERFGLSQLHQLRGRVGRGNLKGMCILVKPDNLSEKALTRLKILEDNHDGFLIAEKDLELRGPGEFCGVRQSGIGEMEISEMIREKDLLQKVIKEVRRLIKSDPELLRPENHNLKIMMEEISKNALEI